MAVATVLDSDLFRKTCGRFATGIAIATVSGPDSIPYGLTVNSFASVSAIPPLVLICIDYRSTLLPYFRASASYCVNVLANDQKSLSERFSERIPDRFEGLVWTPGELGAPVLADCLASMECSVAQTVEAGDHAIFIAEVIRAKYRDGEPLLYFGSDYRAIRGGTVD
jgi:flavin reductase (DIM6/NTAB) family NADH-FMN oxidoreductase RutF